MWKFVVAVVVVFIAILLNLYYNQPVYDGMSGESQHALRVVGAVIIGARFMGQVGTLAGFGDPYIIQRHLFKLACKVVGLPKPPGDMKITDTTLVGVPVRVYKPFKGSGENAKKLPALIYYHGGGWTHRDLDQYNFLCFKLSLAANIIVVSVDYRLAPEHTFPDQFNDCYNVTTFLLSKGEKLGIDMSHIYIGGDSAGGNLAAAIALELKDQQHKPAAQILIYPALQVLDLSLPSYERYGTAILDKRQMAEFWSLYLNGTTNFANIFFSGSHAKHLKNTKYHAYIKHIDNQELKEEPSNEKSSKPDLPENVLKAITNPKVAPLMSDNFKGLPPTLLITAQFDVLSSEGLLYKLRLEGAGVKVTHLNFQSFHAFYSETFDGPFATEEGKNAFSETVKFLKQFE